MLRWGHRILLLPHPKPTPSTENTGWGETLERASPELRAQLSGLIPLHPEQLWGREQGKDQAHMCPKESASLWQRSPDSGTARLQGGIVGAIATDSGDNCNLWPRLGGRARAGSVPRGRACASTRGACHQPALSLWGPN